MSSGDPFDPKAFLAETSDAPEAAFDPEAFLAETSAEGDAQPVAPFDPEAFLAETSDAPVAPFDPEAFLAETSDEQPLEPQQPQTPDWYNQPKPTFVSLTPAEVAAYPKFAKVVETEKRVWWLTEKLKAAGQWYLDVSSADDQKVAAEWATHQAKYSSPFENPNPFATLVDPNVNPVIAPFVAKNAPGISSLSFLSDASPSLNPVVDLAAAFAARDTSSKKSLEVDSLESDAVREGGSTAIIGQRWKEAQRGLEVSSLSYDEMMHVLGGSDPTETKARIAALESQLPLNLREQGLTAALASLAAGVAPTVKTAVESGAGAATGAAAAALGAFVATKDPAAAAQAAQMGAKVGGTVGAAQSTLRLEAGSTFRNSAKWVNADGQPLDPLTRAGAAILAGALKTGVELVELKVLLNALGPTVAAAVTTEGAASLRVVIARDPTVLPLLQRVAKGWATTVAAETAEEPTQTLVEQSIQTGVTGRSAFDAGDLIESTWEAAKVAGLTFGLGGGILQAGVEMHALNEVKRGMPKKGPLLALAAEPEMQDNPAEFAQLAAANGGTPLYVQGEAIQRFFQERNDSPEQVTAALEEALGPGAADRVAEAVVAGDLVEVPLVDIPRWAKSEASQALKQDTAMHPGHLTEREIAAGGTVIEAEAKRMAEEHLAQYADKEAFTARMDVLEEQLVGLGRTKRDVKVEVALWRHFVSTLAKDSGKTPTQVFDDMVVTFAKGSEKTTAEMLGTGTPLAQLDPRVQAFLELTQGLDLPDVLPAEASTIPAAPGAPAPAAPTPSSRSALATALLATMEKHPAVEQSRPNGRGSTSSVAAPAVPGTEAAPGLAQGTVVAPEAVQPLQQGATEAAPAVTAEQAAVPAGEKSLETSGKEALARQEALAEEEDRAAEAHLAAQAQVVEQLRAEGREWTRFEDEDGNVSYFSTKDEQDARVDYPQLSEEQEAAAHSPDAMPSEDDSSISWDARESVRQASAPPTATLTAISEVAPVRSDGTINAGEVLEKRGPLLQTRDLEEWITKFLANKAVQATYSKGELDQFVTGMRASREIFQQAIDQGFMPEELKGTTTPLRTNSDFIKSFDLTTICPKQDQYTATIEAVERKLAAEAGAKGQTSKLLTPTERHRVGLMMAAIGAQPACWYCYGQAGRDAWDAVVEMSVKVTGQALKVLADPKHTAQQWTDIFRPPSNPDMDWTPTGKLATFIRQNADRLSTEGLPDSTRLRDLARGILSVKEKPPTPLEVEYAMVVRVHAYASTRANDPKGWAPLKQQLLRMRQVQIDEMNARAGLRWNSQTDMRPWHVIEYSQAIASMRTKKLAGHVYTKEPNFLKVFGKTGLKFNLSAFYASNPDGSLQRDSQGRPVFNGVIGMKGEDIEHWIKELPRDAGGMLVAHNDEALLAGLLDERIHQIIPFHAGQLAQSKAIETAEHARDYSSHQHEEGWETRTVPKAEKPKSSKPLSAEQLAKAAEKEKAAKEKAAANAAAGIDTKVRLDTEVNVGGTWVKKGTKVEVEVKGQTVTVSAGESLDHSSHKSDEALYLALCEKLNLTPKFAKVEMTARDGTVSRLLSKSEAGHWKVENPNYMKLIRDVAREPNNQVVPDPMLIDLEAAHQVESQWVAEKGDKTEADPRLVAHILSRIKRADWPKVSKEFTEEEAVTVRTAKEKRAAEKEGRAPRPVPRLRKTGTESAAPLLAENPSSDVPHGYIDKPDLQATKLLLNIFLNQSANASTSLHEAAHGWLLMYERMVAKPDATEAVKAKWSRIRKWLDVAEGASPNKDQHEKFARHFEQWLLEGNAPTKDLESIFNSLKRWMLNVYKAITGVRGVELNAEVRAIFDSLLATEAEVAAYRQAQGPDLFPNAQAAGVSEAAWQAQLEASRDAVSEGSRPAELRAAKHALRVHEKWWKDGVKKLRPTYEEAYEELPGRRAQLRLQGFTPGEKRKGPAIELDRGLVETVVGNAKLPEGVVLVSKGGVRPGAIAEELGFNSAQTMLAALAGLKEKSAWVDEQTQREMERLHPSIFTRRNELTALIADGLSSYTERRLLDEMKALRKRDPRLGTAPMATIKKAAALIVERRQLGQLGTRTALQRERTAAQRKARFAAQGNWQGAMKALQEEALNAQLYTLLQEAEKLRDSLETAAGALGKTDARKRLGKAHEHYRDAVDFLLAAVGLGDNGGELDIGVLAKAVMQMNNDAVYIGDPAWLEPLQKALPHVQDYTKLNVLEAGHLRDALRSIRAAAGHRTEVLIEGKRIDRDVVKGHLTEEAETNKKQAANLPSSESAATLKQKAAALPGLLTMPLLKIEVMVDWLGGSLVGKNPRDSWWYMAIFKPLESARQREADLNHRLIEPIVRAFHDIPTKVRDSWTDAFDGKAAFPDHRVGNGKQKLDPPTKRFELLMMALNSGNLSSLERLLLGRNITPEQLRAALNGLTKEEIAWVNTVGQSFESMWPEIQALEERTSGIRPEGVEKQALVLTNGTIIGHYFPALYDSRVSTTGEKQRAQVVADLMDPRFSRPGTPHSHTKARVEGFSGPIQLEPNAIAIHLAQAAHDLAFREVLMSVGGLVLDADIQVALKNALGLARASSFLQWLKDNGVATGAEGAANAGWYLSAMRKLRANTVISALGYSLGNFTEDFSNTFMAFFDKELSVGHYAQGLLAFWENPFAAVAEVRAKSATMRAADDSLKADLTARVREFTTKAPWWYRFIQDHAFVLMEATFHGTATPIWMARYNQALEEGETEKQALDAADKALRRLFPMHSPVNAANVLRDRGAVGMSIQFYGMFSTALNVLLDNWQTIYESSPKMKAKAVVRSLGYMGAFALVGGILRGRGPDKNEPPEKWAARTLLNSTFALVPFLGDMGQFATAMLGGRRPTARPGTALGSALWTIGDLALAAKRADGSFNQEMAVAAARTFGLVMGFPTSQPIRTGKYLYERKKKDDFLETVSGIFYGQTNEQPLTVPKLVDKAFK